MDVPKKSKLLIIWNGGSTSLQSRGSAPAPPWRPRNPPRLTLHRASALLASISTALDVEAGLPPSPPRLRLPQPSRARGPAAFFSTGLTRPSPPERWSLHRWTPCADEPPFPNSKEILLSKRVLQTYVSSVSDVSEVRCKCFILVLQK
jgi:hypothetical protein